MPELREVTRYFDCRLEDVIEAAVSYDEARSEGNRHKMVPRQKHLLQALRDLEQARADLRKAHYSSDREIVL